MKQHVNWAQNSVKKKSIQATYKQNRTFLSSSVTANSGSKSISSFMPMSYNQSNLHINKAAALDITFILSAFREYERALASTAFTNSIH